MNSSPTTPQTSRRTDAISRVRATSSPRSRSPYKKTTLAFKRQVLEHLRDVSNGNKSQTALHFGIDRKSVYDYLKRECQIYASPSPRTRCRVEVDPVGKWPELDNKLHEYFKTERAEKRPMNRRKLRRRALQLASDFGISEFKASGSYLSRFCQRKGITSRAITHMAQFDTRTKDKVQASILTFFDQLNRSIVFYDKSCILNMDESTVYFDMVQKRPLSQVDVNTNGNDKMRFTVALTIAASGVFLPPYVSFR